MAEQKTQLQLKKSPSAKLLDRDDIESVTAYLRKHDKQKETGSTKEASEKQPSQKQPSQNQPSQNQPSQSQSSQSQPSQILPAQSSGSQNGKKPENIKNETTKKIPTANTNKTTISSTPIKMHHDFACTPTDLFRAFTVPEMIKAYSGSDTVFDGKKSVLFGGNVIIETISEEQDKSITQKWRFKSWPEDIWSKVTMNFETHKGQTRWTLEHANVVSEDVTRVEEGWRGNYISRIKGVFGWGGSFF